MRDGPGIRRPRGAALAGILAAVEVWLAGAAHAGSPSTSAVVSEGAWHKSVVAVCVNGSKQTETLIVLEDAKEHVWLSKAQISRLHLRVPKAVISWHGAQYYELESLTGLQVRVDLAGDTLNLTIPASDFLASTLSAVQAILPLTPPGPPGVVFNYQLYGERSSGAFEGGGLAGLTLFNVAEGGVFTSDYTLRASPGSTEGIRLDTAFRKDFEDRLVTLTMGDSISDPGDFGEAVRFAGLAIGTDFSLRPDFLTMPLLTAAGSAVVPSTVQVFVDGQPKFTRDVPAGPFTISGIPAVSGTGNVQLVVRNALGQAQVINEPFYASPSLLAPGLDRYSFDVGPVRENYAFASNDYGPFLASATFSRGLTDDLTVGAHAEALSGAGHAVGGSVVAQIGMLGVASASAAVGGEGSSAGWLASAGFSHSGERLSVQLKTTYRSDAFREAGDSLSPAALFESQSLAGFGLNLGRFGSLSMAYADETFRGFAAEKTLTLSDSFSFGRKGFLELTMGRQVGSEDSKYAELTFTLGLGRTSTSVSAIASNAPGRPGEEELASIEHSTPAGVGTGWQLSATTGGDYDAQAEHNFQQIQVQAEAMRFGGSDQQSINAQGSIAYLDGAARFSMAIPSSFAVVDLDGISGVPVYCDNQLVGKTDASGKIVVSNLLPYQPNVISIDPTTVPLDTIITAKEITVVPRFGSGVVVHFPIKRIHPAIFRLRLPSGSPVPVGAQVNLDGKTFTVVMHGVVYATQFKSGSAEAVWPKGRCTFDLPTPSKDSELPNLGVIPCHPEHIP